MKFAKLLPLLVTTALGASAMIAAENDTSDNSLEAYIKKNIEHLPPAPSKASEPLPISAGLVLQALSSEADLRNFVQGQVDVDYPLYVKYVDYTHIGSGKYTEITRNAVNFDGTTSELRDHDRIGFSANLLNNNRFEASIWWVENYYTIKGSYTYDNTYLTLNADDDYTGQIYFSRWGSGTWMQTSVSPSIKLNGKMYVGEWK